MRILANYGCRTNGDSYTVTFETMGDVPSDKAPGAVDELFRLAKEAIRRQIEVSDPWSVPSPEPGVTVPRPKGSGGGPPNGRRPSIKDPSLPATPKQIGLLRRLAKESGTRVENLDGLTMGEASEKIDELLAVRG